MESPLRRKACLFFFFFLASDSSGQLLTGRPGRSFVIHLREGTSMLCARRALGLRCGEKQLLRVRHASQWRLQGRHPYSQAVLDPNPNSMNRLSINGS